MFNPNFIAEPGIQKEISDASWSYLQKKVEVISEDPVKKTVEKIKIQRLNWQFMPGQSV